MGADVLDQPIVQFLKLDSLSAVVGGHSKRGRSATVAAAMFSLKLLQGVRRAGIATFLPSLGGLTTMIDVGANLRCRPEHLFQYGIMAAEYTGHFLDKPDCTIGLLNIGHEDAKGTELIRETRQLDLQMDQPVWVKIDPTAINLYDQTSGLLLTPE